MGAKSSENAFEDLEFLELRQLVRHMVERSGKSASQVSRDAGRKSGYIGTIVNRGTVPGLAALADIAEACGYVLELRGTDEVISVLPRNVNPMADHHRDMWGSEVLALANEGTRHVVTGDDIDQTAVDLRGLGSLLPDGVPIDALTDLGAKMYRVDKRGVLTVYGAEWKVVAMFPVGIQPKDSE